MTLDAPPPPASTMRRDLISAYAASGMKVLSWAVVSALVYRSSRFDHFAVLVLARSMIGLLNYTTLGLAPAIIARLARAQAPLAVLPVPAGQPPAPLEYATPRPVRETPEAVMVSALRIAAVSALVGAVIAAVYSELFTWVHNIRVPVIANYGPLTAALLGFGVAMRLASDAVGAILQARGRIAKDNWSLCAADLMWIALAGLHAIRNEVTAPAAAMTFLVSSLVLLVTRFRLASVNLGVAFFDAGRTTWSITRQLLSFGILVTLAQLADFLYAPMNLFLIGRLIGLSGVTTYAPAVQIDAALLLLVGGLASVLLPKAAAAHVRGNLNALRVYYVRGTVASLIMLTAAGLATWVLAPEIFSVWLGDSMPATRAILPLVLIHTVVGGSSAVGRSVLLGMGKVKPFTAAVLVAGVANVVMSYCFVRFLGLGLTGIVLGTIIAVVARCAIWQPWYVWRCLKRP